MDNVGIVVESLDTAIAFFTELGMQLEGRATIEGDWAGRVTGLGRQHVEMAMLVTLVFPLVILALAAISSVAGFGTSSISNPGPHGFTQILYAFTSMAGNNGSAFGGLNGNTPWYNVSGAITMLVGRFFMIIPMLAIAGKNRLKLLGGVMVAILLLAVAGYLVFATKPAEFDPRNYLGPAREAITKMVQRKLHVLNSAGKTDAVLKHWEKLGKPLPKFYSAK